MHVGPARDSQELSPVRILGVLWLLWFVFVGISPVFAEIVVYAPWMDISVFIGDDVLFSVNFTSFSMPKVRWEFQAIDGRPTSFEIATFNVSDTTNMEVLPSYKGRLSVYSNGSMTLKHVSEADNGTYTAVFVTYGPEGNTNIDLKLQIFETLPSFFIEMNSTHSESTVTLTCKTNSSLVSYVSYHWIYLCDDDWVPVPQSLNTSSIPVNVTRTFFICTASNPLNKKQSDAFLLESNCTDRVNKESKQVVKVFLGNSAKFYLKGNTSTGDMFAVEWTFQKSQSQVAVAMINDSTRVAEGYAGRVKMNESNGSMTLVEVQQSDVGNYAAYVSSCDKRWQEVIELQVKAPSHTTALIGGLVGGVIGLLLLLLVLTGCIYYHRQKKVRSPGRLQGRSEDIPVHFGVTQEVQSTEIFGSRTSISTSENKQGDNDLSNNNLEISSESHDYGVMNTEHEGSVKIRTLTFEGAERLRMSGMREVQMQGLLYVHQREIAACPPGDAAVTLLGSDDATTCHLLVLKDRGSGALCLAHCDGSDVTWGVRHMVEAVRSLAGTACERLELHIIGGFADRAGVSDRLTHDIIGEFVQQKEDVHLLTFCASELNTILRSGVQHPAIYGIAVDVRTGNLFPARFPDRGPDSVLRSARIFSCNTMEDVYSAEHGELHVGPYHWEPWNDAIFWLSQPDYVLLKHLSTSPAVEPPDFVSRLRDQLRFRLEHPTPQKLFPHGKSRIYRRNGEGLWELVH
uniref:uncharacterized protein isoform X2 n=1 Tax=Myxine glutinosa TaxID=7769 RepID=UPI00358FFF64